MFASLWRFQYCLPVLAWVALAHGTFASDTEFILESGATDGNAITKASSRRGVRAVRTNNDRLSDASFATFAKWLNLYGVYTHNTTITGVGFTKLVQHAHLRQVSLFGPNVNDDGLHAVSQLRHVTHLQFGNGWDNKDCTSEKCKHRLHRAIITDRALSWVAQMPNLAYLTIDNADITDDGIQHLGTLQSVEYISFLRCPKLTLEGVDRLKTALPKTRIILHEN
jgi:hypothetical protein